MTLTDLEKLLLVSVLADRDRLASQSPIWERGEDRHLFARRRCAIEDARVGIVSLDWPRWRGGACDATQRQGNSRAVKKLMQSGLLIGYGDTQIKAVQLTESGETLAKAITSGSEASA